MSYTIPVTENKCFFVFDLTQTTHTQPLVYYQRTHLSERMRSWAPWSGTAFNQVLSSAGRSHGPLLLILLWTLWSMCVKNCTNRKCAQGRWHLCFCSLRPFNPWISVCVKGKPGLWYDPCHMTYLGFICNTYPPRPIVLSTSWYVISIKKKTPWI